MPSTGIKGSKRKAPARRSIAKRARKSHTELGDDNEKDGSGRGDISGVTSSVCKKNNVRVDKDTKNNKADKRIDPGSKPSASLRRKKKRLKPSLPIKIAATTNSPNLRGKRITRSMSQQENSIGDRNDKTVKDEITVNPASSEKNPSPSEKSGRGPVEERTCPHCQVVLVSTFALNYHVENYVCRRKECDDPVLINKFNRKRGKGKAGDTPGKRKRGPLDERTCRDCGRIFTSALGAEYHIKHKVCKATKKDEIKVYYHQLQPGERFVTNFGVVEVVKDDRAISTAEPPPNIKTLVRSYQTARAKLEDEVSKWTDYRWMHLRARRHRINQVYEKGDIQQGTVFQAYFGGDPRRIKKKTIRAPKKPPTDPTAPESSFPDRIVECILIPDKRTRYINSTDEDPMNVRIEDPKPNNPTRLFLRRDALTDTYNEDANAYICLKCGQKFSSVSGHRYHGKGPVCEQKKMVATKAAEDKATLISDGAFRILDGIHVPEPPPPPTRSDRSRGKPREKKRKKKKKELGIYPEVLIALGFVFVKEDMKFTEDMNLPAPVVDGKKEEVEIQDSLLVDPPDALLESLKKKLALQQRVADDQKYGSMYAGVFKALDYKRPRKRKPAINIGPGEGRKRRQKKEKPPPPPKPLPPIIDTLALADEVDSGRYPSMKRNKENDHQETCLLCKDGGDLICCDFCTNAEHLACIRKKFTIKDPEPKDDFMCHKCIQTVLARRARAEKRRREKQERDTLKNQQEALEVSKKTAGMEKGKEYEFMAKKGQEVSELVELLQDAQIRLQQCLATSTMNNARRRILGCFRKEK